MSKMHFRLVAILIVLATYDTDALAQDRTDYYPLLIAIERFKSDSKDNSRIVGGRPVSAITDHPWQVALLHSGDSNKQRAQFCGGTVIAPTLVLTAAHCVDGGARPTDINVLTDTTSLQAGRNVFEVSDIIIHKRWNRATGDVDIALLRVKVPEGRALGQAIPLFDKSQPPEGSTVRLTGWGITANRQTGTDILQYVDVPYVPPSVCTRPQSYGTRITYNMLCAGERGKDICSGDSGGPATILVGSERILVGISSWSDGCGLLNKFGVFTKVANFRSWVAENP